MAGQTTDDGFTVGDRVELRYNHYSKNIGITEDRESKKEGFVLAMGDVENCDQLLVEGWAEGWRDGHTDLYRIQFLLDGGDVYIRRLRDVHRYEMGTDGEKLVWQDWQPTGKHGYVVDVRARDRERAEEPPFGCPECGHKLWMADPESNKFHCWSKNGGCGNLFVGPNGEKLSTLRGTDKGEAWAAWQMEQKRERGLLGEYERGWPGYNPYM